MAEPEIPEEFRIENLPDSKHDMFCKKCFDEYWLLNKHHEKAVADVQAMADEILVARDKELRIDPPLGGKRKRKRKRKFVPTPLHYSFILKVAECNCLRAEVKMLEARIKELEARTKELKARADMNPFRLGPPTGDGMTPENSRIHKKFVNDLRREWGLPDRQSNANQGNGEKDPQNDDQTDTNNHA